MNAADQNEIREGEIRRLIPIHAARIRESIKAGGPELAIISDRWTSLLADDEIAMQAVRIAIDTDWSTAGYAICRQVAKIVNAKAEADAIAEVDRMELGRAESVTEQRIEQREFVQSVVREPP